MLDGWWDDPIWPPLHSANEGTLPGLRRCEPAVSLLLGVAWFELAEPRRGKAAELLLSGRACQGGAEGSTAPVPVLRTAPWARRPSARATSLRRSPSSWAVS